MESHTFVSRRLVLRASALVAAIPLLAACGGGAATTATSAAATSAAVTASAAPATTAAATSSAAPATTAAATTSAAAATTAAATSAATTATISIGPINVSGPGFTLVDPKNVKISGKFQVVQQKDWSDIHNAYLNKLVTDYAAQNNWPLDLSYEAGFTGGGNFLQRMAAAVASGTGPDMLWGNYDTFQLNYLKTLQPLDDVYGAAAKVFGEATPGFAPGQKIGGTWFCVPYFNRSGGYWARKSWFANKGIDITTLKDIDAWKEASLAVSDGSKRMWGWGQTVNRSGDGETDVSWPWFQAGNRLTDETGTKVLFNTDLSIQAFDWIKDIYTNPKWAPMLPPGVAAWDDIGNNNAWYAGTIGFTNNAGTLFAASLKTVPTIGNDTFLVQEPASTIGAKQALIGAGGGAVFYLIQGAKNVDATKALIQYMLAKDVQTQLFTTSQGYVNPAWTNWGWDTDPVKNCPNGADLIYKENAFNPNAFAWFNPHPDPLLWVAGVSSAVVFTDTMASILKGTSTKDAVANSQTRIEGIQKQFNGK